MRPSLQFRALFAALTLACLAAPAAQANVLIDVNKNTQTMTVSVDGVPRYNFDVSTGRAGYGTPNGTFHPQRLERTWFSKEYYNSPMPHSIFFHRGFAIHGSYEISRLGGPASHGCVRLNPKNAAKLFSLVKSEGMNATTIVVSGQNPATVRRAPPARRDETPSYRPRYQPYYDNGTYDDGSPYDDEYRYQRRVLPFRPYGFY